MSPPKCQCEKPREYADPRRKGWCCACLRELDPAWLSNDRNMAHFFDHLALSFPGDPPEAFLRLRVECEERERDGRDQFGLSYLIRQNLPEGRQEACDLVLYAYLDSLQTVKKDGEESDIDLVMTIAYHAFKSYEASLKLEARRKGSP